MRSLFMTGVLIPSIIWPNKGPLPQVLYRIYSKNCRVPRSFGSWYHREILRHKLSGRSAGMTITNLYKNKVLGTQTSYLIIVSHILKFSSDLGRRFIQLLPIPLKPLQIQRAATRTSTTIRKGGPPWSCAVAFWMGAF